MSNFEHQDDLNHPVTKTPEFTRIIEEGLSRRQFMGGAALLGLGTLAAGCTPLSMSSGSASSKAMSPDIGFKAIPASTADTITVPEGYRWERLISWGDPLFSDAAEFINGGKNNAYDQERQFGDNNDGMSFFPLSDDRAIMAINNEYTNYEYLFPHQGKQMTRGDVRKAQAAHGVSVFEIRKVNGSWKVVKDSRFNRRIHANTPMELTGPAAGSNLLKTSADPSGTKVLGTFNNCANGQTPWGTYLTCEENFNGYFGSDSSVDLGADAKRYGIGAKDAGYQWHKHDSRFDLSLNPQEPNRHGWVVEIDPQNPDSKPKKRTAL
ncbi:alkaline phosphatase PhoX, partial [Oceanospirillum sp. HFRX-1_2]